MSSKQIIYSDAAEVKALSLPAVADALKTDIQQHYANQLPMLVGIHRGGFYLAQWLHQQLGCEQALGALDISWHRDDLKASSVSPHVKPTRLPVDIDGRDVLLVDDVLFTGRTIRAALNELFDYGRPSAVRLAVLAQRQGRELPIVADFVGAHFDLASSQRINLSAADKDIKDWRLEVSDSDD